MDLNAQRPRCEEHDDPKWPKAGGSQAAAWPVRLVFRAGPRLLVRAPLALALGLWPVWVSELQLTGSEGEAVVICGHVAEPADSGLALVRLGLSPRRARSEQEWDDWTEPGQLWTIRSLF